MARFKFKQFGSGSAFIISDTHLDHWAPGFFQRPFFSLEEMNQSIIDGINDTVGKRDHLIIGGDFALRNPGNWRRQINCRNVHLILGNHDDEVQCLRAFGDSNVSSVRGVSYAGCDYFISHYPHAFWPKSHYGSYHLYGHCHGYKEELLDKILPGRRSMEVSVEVIWKLTGEIRPLEISECKGFLGGRLGHEMIQ